MKLRALLPILLLYLAIWSCRDESGEETLLTAPVKAPYGAGMESLGGEEYYNRVLGALVGSAIGDAMGASTEMWGRDQIRRTYGYITGITPAIRPQSPEGTWDHNLQAGATTDDTRWKALMARYVSNNREELDPESFARMLTDYYRSVVSDLGESALSESTDALDDPLEQANWMREWARVAQAYQQGPEAYIRARDRFYGGDLACAGLLYTPVFGLVAEDPEAAYKIAYDHALFDLGYARDISALAAALTQMALHTSQTDSLLNTAVFTDPYRFEDSRLVGRIALNILESARNSVRMARALNPLTTQAERDSVSAIMPPGYTLGPDAWLRQESVYESLEKDQQALAFHAGEIWQILVAGIEFGQGDFMKTMQFIVNYGRDNDTVAAVAGMILGAQVGFDGLPQDERDLILLVSREQMGLDLEVMASAISGFAAE